MPPLDPYAADLLFQPYTQRLQKFSGEAYFTPPTAADDHSEPYARALAYPVSPAKSRVAPMRRTRPISVAHIGPSFVCAGVESWLRALVSHCDPAVVRFVRNVVTEDHAVDHELLRKVGIPCTFGQDDAVREAVLESDVVLVWGNVPPENLRPKGSTAKVVFVAHGMGDWTRSSLQACSPAVDHVVAVSRIVYDNLCGSYPASVILNGVDQHHIACRSSPEEVRRKLGFDADDFVVGFAGRFSPEKNADVIIDAVARMGASAKALLVGWGPLRYQLMDLCNERIPGRFAFATSQDFLGDYYQIMDALCMPSTEEGFGLVAAEAMLHSVPVISTRVGIAHDLFQNRINGVLAAPEEFADSLCQLQQNPEWASGLGREGRRTALRHCLAADMALEYQKLLQRLVDEPCEEQR